VLGPVTGKQEEKAQILGGDKRAEDFVKTKQGGSGEGSESFGGKDQTAQNPLGL
jgi:hypothetical protein